MNRNVECIRHQLEGRIKGCILKNSVKCMLGKNGVCYTIGCEVKLLFVHKIFAYYIDVYLLFRKYNTCKISSIRPNVFSINF
jgi:hypothetical protein